MKNKILELIDEQKSPLFRIMSLCNDNVPVKRSFSNNISAFHIGNGYILSIAHNLRPEAELVNWISDADYQTDIFNKCNTAEQRFLGRCYILDNQTNKRFLNLTGKNDYQNLAQLLKKINYDTRWITQYNKEICKPFLIINLKNNEFYNDPNVTALFNPDHIFAEAVINTNTFLLELKLIDTYYTQDIAIYRMVNTDSRIIAKIPVAKLNFDVLRTGDLLHCLQGSPSGTNLGRLFNESRVEGLLDQHAIQQDHFGGNFFFEGLRYLLKGYFRFGSSGAPYFRYNEETDLFEVNAIQSEASPIQLSINNDRNGNFQYINAIATPLCAIEERLKNIINGN